MEKNIFEVAAREKYRFEFRGLITTEDLWDLSPINLDSIFKQLNAKLREVQEESLLEVKSRSDKELEVKIEIVKHIVTIKMAEAKAREDAINNREKRETLKGALAEKQKEKLVDMTEEEILAQLKEIE